MNTIQVLLLESADGPSGPPAASSLTCFFLRTSLIREHQFACLPKAIVLSSDIYAGAAPPSAFLYQLQLVGERIFEFSIEALFSDDVLSATGVPGRRYIIFSFERNVETRRVVVDLYLFGFPDPNLLSFG